MRELIDCHMHTDICGHASGTVAQMVSAAVFGGLSGVVITEHLPLPTDLDPTGVLAPESANFATYADQVRATRERVKGMTVALGAEADWLPGREPEMAAQAETARASGVEVVFGSVHFLDGWSFDDPNNVVEWDERDVDAVWEAYFSAWCDAARSGRFDVMAHPDLVKKFGHFPAGDPHDMYADAARAVADSGVAVEFSTAGWRKPVGEPYPGNALLSTLIDVGARFTVGSDAHSTSEVGYRIAEAYEELARAGVGSVYLPLGGGEMKEIEL